MPEHLIASPALAAAAHAVRAARAAQAAGHHALGWDELTAWPAWALPGGEPGQDDTATSPRLALLAAAWHAPALRRCIDGALLQAAAACVGAERLAAVIDHAPPDGTATLPTAAALPEAWAACGRALALAALQPPALQAAVAATLQPPPTLPSPGAAAAVAAVVAWVDTQWPAARARA
jgi:hypothetical protein